MDQVYSDLMDFWKKPHIIEAFVDILLCSVPIWVAVMIGLVIGWSWRPRWTGLVFLGMRTKFRFLWTAPPGFGARRLWFAFTALSAFSVARRLWSNFKGKEEVASHAAASASDETNNGEMQRSGSGISLNLEAPKGQHDIVTEKDLEHLTYLLESKVGDLAWQRLMERTTPSMAYQAWRHEPENGPTIYRSRTVYEDATPELVRDFFWDDEFRHKWDPMLSYFKILDDCPHTGTMIVHWIKKGVPYPSLPKRDKPRRVEHYFSSWIIRAVESRKGDGQLSACEVTLVHYEDMGIPKDVAKLGVRHGMWGTVKKIHSGMRAYQLARKSEASLSRSAVMAQITTKISINGSSSDPSDPQREDEERSSGNELQWKVDHGVDWRWVVIGGTVALVCGFHTGMIGKALVLGAGRRLIRRLLLHLQDPIKGLPHGIHASVFSVRDPRPIPDNPPPRGNDHVRGH